MTYTLASLICSALYAIIYAIFYFGNYRTTFFASLGIATLLVAMIYFLLVSQKKKSPWDPLGNLFIALVLFVIISFTTVLIAGIKASTYLVSANLNFNEFSIIASYAYRISPVFILILNIFNMVALIVHRTK